MTNDAQAPTVLPKEEASTSPEVVSSDDAVTVPDGEVHTEEEKGRFVTILEVISPYAFTPDTPKQWLAFCAIWASIIGPLAFLFVWGFPKLIDHAIDPALQAIKENVHPLLIALIVLTGIIVTPMVFLSKEPFVWLGAMVFTFPQALFLAILGTTITMMVCFWMGRKWLQKWALRWLERYKRTRAVLMSISKAGPFTVILLLRLGPVPYTLTNYFIAVPKDVGFWVAMAASVIGKLPANVLGVVFGRNLKGLAAMLQGEYVPKSQMAINIVSLSSAVIIIVGTYIYARRAMREIEDKAIVDEEEEERKRQQEQQQQEQEQASRDLEPDPCAAPDHASAMSVSMALSASHADRHIATPSHINITGSLPGRKSVDIMGNLSEEGPQGTMPPLPLPGQPIAATLDADASPSYSSTPELEAFQTSTLRAGSLPVKTSNGSGSVELSLMGGSMCDAPAMPHALSCISVTEGAPGQPETCSHGNWDPGSSREPGSRVVVAAEA